MPQHFGRKWARIKNMLIVRVVEGEACICSTLAHSRSASLPREQKLGIMMSSFNKYNRKDGMAKHLMKGYPVFDRRVEATKVTFEHFFSPVNCPYDYHFCHTQECVDMDCDGPKHALVRDVDGIFLESLITEGSIPPFAKLRFDLSRIPLTCVASSGPDIYHSPEDVVEWQGVAWGTDAMGTPAAFIAAVWIQEFA